ncbi:MAG: hypothetical protein LC798_08250 [Chloroflexi bacterium]|nr:hypothetical protein [Chloroflexota bacterium]
MTYLVRPLAVVSGIAVFIGLIAWPLGKYATLTAFVLALLAVTPTYWPLAVLVVAIEVAVGKVQRLRRREPMALGQGVSVVMTIFLLLGVVRTLPMAIQGIEPRTDSASAATTPMYFALLDGYPRIDTLETMGIDNKPFVEALADRGFDHYPDATSLHTSTHRTLEAMLADSTVERAGKNFGDEEGRELRDSLDVPLGFTAVDPGVGHVTLDSGPHLDSGDVNDYEMELLGRSLLRVVAGNWLREQVAAGMRSRIVRSLELTAAMDGRVFTHVMTPYQPFVLGEERLGECWPTCSPYAVPTDWSRYDEHIRALNDLLLDAIDRILERHDDAVIVLYSDHGMRRDPDDEAELRRVLLVARTPGHEHLFADEPHPPALLRTAQEAYP